MNIIGVDGSIAAILMIGLFFFFLIKQDDVASFVMVRE